MAGTKDLVTDGVESAPPIRRLCNEIQLFDLCDLEKCRYKDDRFCTNEDLVAAFEKISDAEVVRRDARLDEELDEDEEDFDDEYGEALEGEFGEDSEFEDEY